jgi:5'-deoxynucleotidase YfbR-like HD superfamily hydrolase
MDRMIELMNLLEIARAQPQYGYNLAGGMARIGNLAEHHYLVTMIGWQLAEMVNAEGAQIDTFKVVKYCLLHDIGEVFGGDIGMYYAKANPGARRLAKKFEEENQKYLSRFFTNKKEVRALAKEVLDSKSDEAHIAKIADYLEVTHYKFFNGLMKDRDLELISPKLQKKVIKIKDQIARNALETFIRVWENKMANYEAFIDASADALKV